MRGLWRRGGGGWTEKIRGVGGKFPPPPLPSLSVNPPPPLVNITHQTHRGPRSTWILNWLHPDVWLGHPHILAISLDWLYFVNFKQYPLLRMDKRHTDFLIRISCNEKSANLWRGAFLPRGGLFSLSKNARGGIFARGAFQTLTPATSVFFRYRSIFLSVKTGIYRSSGISGACSYCQ